MSSEEGKESKDIKKGTFIAEQAFIKTLTADTPRPDPPKLRKVDSSQGS